MNKDNNKSATYVDYDSQDTKYAGAKIVIEAELEDLKKRRSADPDNLKGLALSGGGIRSASFCLGVTQALAKHGKLKQFDYMSTVSGASYLGGSLSWLWLGKWKEGTDCNRTFGTDANNFPYGTGSRHSNINDPDLDKDQATMMRYLTQHGSYLTPGKGITLFSLLSVILRGFTMGFLTLMVFAISFFYLLHYIPSYLFGFEPEYFSSKNVLILGVNGIIFYTLLSVIFSAIHEHYSEKSYLWRRRWDEWSGYVLIISVLFLTIAAVYYLNEYIQDAESIAFTSSIAGALLAWYSQRSANAQKQNKRSISKPILIYAGIIVLLLSILVLAEYIASGIYEGRLFIEYSKYIPFDGSFLDIVKKDEHHHIVAGYGLLILVILSIIAYLTPINKISIHRYYRDRLMELFNPDVCSVITQGNTETAKKANNISMANCLPDDNNDMPYHIINTNIILADSNIAKFRGRGGDNFIFSPLYSGSNATGWQESEVFANNTITLPTAVAISGAAANSNSGVAGQGLTVNPLFSTLMLIFNLRLGYWTVNPNTNCQPNQAKMPNHLHPGISGVITNNELNEQSGFIQLSDGGHFENLAIYELLRRHCRLIICCDAEQDNEFVFGSLSNIIQKARVDFGVKIDIPENKLSELKYRNNADGTLEFAKKGYLTADIIYPCNDEPNGQLIYIKTTLPEGLPADIMGYKYTHPNFPDETTTDQFFDEKQMEAYRMLGMYIAELVIKEKESTINW